LSGPLWMCCQYCHFPRYWPSYMMIVGRHAWALLPWCIFPAFSVRPTSVKLLFNVICIKDVTSFPDIKLLHAYNAHESLSQASILNISSGKLSKECVFGTKKRYSCLLDNDRPTWHADAQLMTSTNAPSPLVFKSCIFRAEYVYLSPGGGMWVYGLDWAGPG